MTTENTAPLGTYDAFRNVVSWDDATARQWAAALDLRAAASDQMALRAAVVSASNLRSGDVVVEVGCGTGALLTDLAECVGAQGTAVGVEPQPVFAKEARRRIALSGLSNRVSVHEASATALPLAGGVAAACVAQTVLIHLPAPVLGDVLREMTRVTAPGGRVVSADQDGDTWTINHPDRHLTRRIIRFNTDQRYADGWTGRHLSGLLRSVGLDKVCVEPLVHAETTPGAYLMGMATRIARAAATVGVITNEACDDWLAELESLAAQGMYFSSINYYVAFGIRPRQRGTS